MDYPGFDINFFYGEYVGWVIEDNCGPKRYYSTEFVGDGVSWSLTTAETQEIEGTTASFSATNTGNAAREETELIICWDIREGTFGFTLARDP